MCTLSIIRPLETVFFLFISFFFHWEHLKAACAMNLCWMIYIFHKCFKFVDELVFSSPEAEYQLQQNCPTGLMCVVNV